MRFGLFCVPKEKLIMVVSIAYKANKGRKYKKKIKYKNYLKIDKSHAKGFDCSNSLPYLTSPNKVIIPFLNHKANFFSQIIKSH